MNLISGGKCLVVNIKSYCVADNKKILVYSKSLVNGMLWLIQCSEYLEVNM